MPRYSIVIPTRDRADTLKWSVATALAMEGEDFEVVVQDNASGPETLAVLEAFDDPRLVYSRSERPLSMSENWEQALGVCEGEWIHFIGDDDGMMPKACVAMRHLLESVPTAEVVTWKSHSYWWEDCIVDYNQNRLYVRMSPSIGTWWVKSEGVARPYFTQEVGWDVLPMIYNSFVHRKVIERVQQKAGAYFPTIAPDIFSGMANLWAVDRFVRTERALNMRGTSRHSIGVAKLYPKLGATVAAQFTQECEDGRPLHRSLIPSGHTSILLANENCLAQALLYDERPEYALSIPRLIARMLHNIHAHSEDYDATLKDVLALAAHNRLKLDPSIIPPRKEKLPLVAQNGLSLNKEGQVEHISIDGKLAGLKNIYEATRLAAAMGA